MNGTAKGVVNGLEQAPERRVPGCLTGQTELLSRPIGPEFLVALLLSGQALSVRARSAPSLSDRLQLDERVDQCFRQCSAATRCDTMWYTTAMCGRRPRPHWGAFASSSSHYGQR